MSKADWRPFMPQDKGFKQWHGIVWVLYLWTIKLNLEMLLDVKSSSGVSLLPAVLLSWLAVITAAYCIEPWLDGANRWLVFRLALVLTALLSCVLGVWMLWHYGVFLFVGLITLFQRPFELITLALFGERLMVMLAGLLTFATYAWLSLRVVRVLLSGDLTTNFAQVLGQQALGEEAATGRQPGHRRVGPLPQVDLGIKVRKQYDHLIPSPKMQAARQFVGPPKPPERPGKQRYLTRPRELEPKFDGTYERYGPPVLQGLSFSRGNAPQKRERCQTIAWAGFEWVFRTEPSLEELVWTLEALPNLASSIDEDDAVEARNWISRLADHPGQYERPIPYQEIVDHINSETIRVADVAFRSLIEWDGERSRLGHGRG